MISKVAVIGSGTMGSGIAGQLANAGIQVRLLDIKTDGDSPNAVAERAIERLRKSSPPLIVDESVLRHIEIGNIEDDLGKIADCDWIVEAIVERLELKRTLYRQIDRVSKPDAIVSSNTSTIPMKLLVEDMPPAFHQRFAITHFFNPVRYMRLLELVQGDETDSTVFDELWKFNDEKMGKGIVPCRDTPGFLGNRVGVFALQVGIDEATRCGLTIEEADALMGRPMGIPKTGVFGLYDLIGLDLMADVVKSLKSILPDGDAFHAVSAENPLITQLINEGYTGLKGKGGFYRTADEQKEAVDLASGQWRPSQRLLPELAEIGETQGIAKLIEGNTPQHRFCRRVLGRVLAYAASLIPEVADEPTPIDDAMKLGYNWIQGPFELIDEIGVSNFVDLLQNENIDVPAYIENASGQSSYRVHQGQLQVRQADNQYAHLQRAPGVIRFNETRRSLKPLADNESASLFVLPEEVGLVEFHSKANALDDKSMAIVAEAASRAGKDFRGIIVHNDGPHFSAGVNLHRFREFMENKDWQGMDDFLLDFQNAVKALKYCKVPVIAAPSGLTIGGGYEITAHCDVLVTHTNVVLGLVESMVGVLPGGGGVKDTLFRWHKRLGNWTDAAQKTFMNVGYGKTGASPQEAEKLVYFRPEKDRQVMNRDRLVEGALKVIDELAPAYSPTGKPVFNLPGREVFSQMQSFLKDAHEKGHLTPQDTVVGTELAKIVTGGNIDPQDNVSEDDLFDAERQAFINLAKTEATHARIAHMLDHGGALRN